MSLNKCLINCATKQDFYELLQKPKSVGWSYKEAYLQQLPAKLFCGIHLPDASETPEEVLSLQHLEVIQQILNRDAPGNF